MHHCVASDHTSLQKAKYIIAKNAAANNDLIFARPIPRRRKKTGGVQMRFDFLFQNWRLFKFILFNLQYSAWLSSAAAYRAMCFSRERCLPAEIVRTRR